MQDLSPGLWLLLTLQICFFSSPGMMMVMRKGPPRVISTENGLYGVIFSTICQSSKSEFKAAATSLNVPSSTIKTTTDKQGLQIGCKRNNIWQWFMSTIVHSWMFIYSIPSIALDILQNLVPFLLLGDIKLNNVKFGTGEFPQLLSSFSLLISK